MEEKAKATKSYECKIAITNNNKILSVENTTSLPDDSVDSHLIIIGLLENLKQKHLKRLNTELERTIKK